MVEKVVCLSICGELCHLHEEQGNSDYYMFYYTGSEDATVIQREILNRIPDSCVVSYDGYELLFQVPVEFWDNLNA